MTITVNVHDVSLQVNVTIPVSGLIVSVTSDSDSDAITNWEFIGAGDGHFNINGVPQDPNFPTTVTNAELNEVTYTAGPNVGGYDYLHIEADDSVTGASSDGGNLIAEFNATGSQPIESTDGNPFFEFHAGGTVNQTFIGNGNHDIIFMPAKNTFVDFTFDTLSNGDVVFTPGKGPSFTVRDVEEVQFVDNTMFIENSDNANIARLYSAAFDRVPDDQGLAFWENVYANNVSSSAKAAGYYVSLAQTNDGSGTSIAGGFMQSSEFTNRYGTLTDTGFVNALYQNVLGRGPDQAGLSFWLNQLEDNGQTREVVLVGFAESPENVTKTAGDHGGWLIQV